MSIFCLKQPVTGSYPETDKSSTHSPILVKVKCTLVQALRLCTGRTAHTRRRGIALLFHDHGTRKKWEVSVTPRPLLTPGKDTVPIVQEAGWAPEPVWTGAENLALSGSLYRLRYPAPPILVLEDICNIIVPHIPLRPPSEILSSFFPDKKCTFHFWHLYSVYCNNHSFHSLTIYRILQQSHISLSHCIPYNATITHFTLSLYTVYCNNHTFHSLIVYCILQQSHISLSHCIPYTATITHFLID
jgi:hypothetical protein